MEYTDVIHRRRMVRRYDPDRPVPVEAIQRCLDDAVRAPSAGFSQGWDFLVLDTPESREAFWTATTEPGGEPDQWLAGMQTAPALIVCLSHKDAYLDRYAAPDKGWEDRDEARWPVPYWDVDTGMASLIILLSAVDQGLASLFFGVPPTQHAALREALAIPESRNIVGVVALGYGVPGPKSPSLKRHRRTGEEVSHWGRFGVPRSTT